MAKTTTRKRSSGTAAERKAKGEARRNAKFAEAGAKIIAAIEAGMADPAGWHMPWHRLGGIGNGPINALTLKNYTMGNWAYLSIMAMADGHENTWATVRQWNELGFQVMRGEHGTLCSSWTSKEKIVLDEAKRPVIDPKTGRPKTKRFMIPNTFFLHSLSQVDEKCADCGRWHDGPHTFTVGEERTCEVFVSNGARAKLAARLKRTDTLANLPEVQRHELAEILLTSTGCETVWGGDRACYSPSSDVVRVPHPNQFESTHALYCTWGHEQIHWTGHPSRLDRERVGMFGSPKYAFEELVAEIGVAMLLARLGMSTEPRQDHLDYVASWLRALKDDPETLHKAASQAGKAANLLWELGGMADEDEAQGDDLEVADEVADGAEGVTAAA